MADIIAQNVMNCGPQRGRLPATGESDLTSGRSDLLLEKPGLPTVNEI
jgi:hypothetical protein